MFLDVFLETSMLQSVIIIRYGRETEIKKDKQFKPLEISQKSSQKCAENAIRRLYSIST